MDSSSNTASTAALAPSNKACFVIVTVYCLTSSLYSPLVYVVLSPAEYVNSSTAML